MVAVVAIDAAMAADSAAAVNWLEQLNNFLKSGRRGDRFFVSSRLGARRGANYLKR
jgi:hypothetical protein